MITLSGCVFIEQEKLLVIWKINHGHYELPGGKVEPGESLEQTAIRETTEEIGCRPTLIKHLGHIDFKIKGKDFRSHNYLADLNAQTPKITEPQTFRDIFWMPIKNYKNYQVAPNVKIFCENYTLEEKPEDAPFAQSK